jgi:hypothetical protein
LDPKLIQEFFVGDWLQKIYQIQFSIKNFPLMIDRFASNSSSGVVSKSPPAKSSKATTLPVASKVSAPSVAPKKEKTLGKSAPVKKVIASKKVQAPKTKAVAKKTAKK